MRTEYVTVSDGTRISAHLFGNPDSTPLLICHGLGADYRQWVADAEYFSQERFVIVPDLRGHGHSGIPDKAGVEDFTIPRMARDVETVLDRLGADRCDFLGNSLGGLVGLELINAAPSKVRSLMTCGTTYELHFSKLIVWVRWLTFKILSDKSISKMIAKRGTRIDRARPLIGLLYEKNNRHVLHWINHNIHDYDYLETARKFAGSICLLKGEDDREINRQLASTEAILEEKANARIVALPRAGHFTNLDQPEMFRKAVEVFLRDVR